MNLFWRYSPANYYTFKSVNLHEIYVLEEVIVNPYNISLYMLPNEDGLRWDSCTWWILNAAWYQGHLLKKLLHKKFIFVYP